MSDELPAGAMRLEEPAPDPGAAESTTITGPDPTQAADLEDEGEPDGTIAGSGGVKFVPLQAVQEARARAKEAKAELAKAAATLTEAQAKAQKFDEMSRYVEEARPLIETLRHRPDLIRAAKEPPNPEPVPAGPLADQEAIDYAKDMDLYLPDGTPDTARAQRLAARQEAIAARSAQKMVAPYQERDAQTQSAALRDQVARYKDSHGQTVDPQVLDEIWGSLPAEMSARPEVAGVLHRVALAETILRGKYKGLIPDQTPPPALRTESLGGSRPDPGGQLSDLDQRFMKAAGMDRKDYVTNAARFKPNTTNILE